MIAVKMSETPSTNYSLTQPHTSGSEESLSPRPLNVTDPIVAKRICFYKSGDPQFNGVKMVVNNRSFKSFDALLDNLSKRVPLPFGVRTITTPRGIHGITSLEDLEDGKSYICSQQKKIKPINLEKASKKPLPWQISRPVSARRKAVQLAREGEDGAFQRGGNIRISTPKKLLVFKNGDVRVRRTIVLGKKNTQNFEAFLDNISELMQYPVVKLYTTDGRKVPNLQALILCSGAVVAAGREPFRPGNYDPHRYSLPGRLPGISNRVYPKTNAKSEGRKNTSSRSQIFSTSSYKGYSNDNDSASSYVPDNGIGLAENHSHGGEDLPVVPSEDDIEKSVHLNQDGSMTVEMRVRFRIKEDETIRWTTTVSRAGFATDGNAKTSISAVDAEDQSSELNVLTCENIAENANSAEEDAADQQTGEEMNNKELEACNYDIWQNPSMHVESDNDMVKPHFYRPPTPGPRRVRKKKAVVESVTMVSDTAVQKKMVGQFSYSEETDTGETKSEYCLVTHSSSKTTNVNDSKLTKTSSNQVPKQSLKGEGEDEILNKTHHQTTTERSTDLPDEDGLSQNFLEKSAVNEEPHNCRTSDYNPDISHEESSQRNSNASEEDLANQRSAMETELNHSDGTQFKEEMICNQQDSLSHSSIHPPPDESHQTVCQYANITTTMTESSITANNSSVECIMTHLSNESQVVTSNSKKKKKKKKRKSSSDIREQGKHDQCSLPDIAMEGMVENGVTVCEMEVTEDATPYPSSQIITVHKRALEILVHNTNGSYKSVDAEEDVYSQVSMNHQQNESDFKQDLDSQMPEVNLNSDKQEDPMLGKSYSKNEIEPISEGILDSTSINVQAPFGIAPREPLNETDGGVKEETEKGKPFKQSMKQKKIKKHKKRESSPRSQAKVFDDHCSMDAFSHVNETVEQSLESYVQSWLQNIFPWAVTPAKNLAPINSNERTMHLLSDTSFSDKENQLERKNVYLMGENNISESKLSNSTLNNLNEIGIVEEPIKDCHEKYVDCLTDADASIIDDMTSDIYCSTKQSICDMIHANDRKSPLETDSQCLSEYQRCSSEIAIQTDPKAIDSILETNVQTDCVSSLLLHQLKSAVFNFEKSHIGCVEKTCCLTDISPSLLGSSSDLLLAWLLVQNFKESLSRMNNDDISQTTCNFSELIRLQQYLKQVMAKEEAKDLENNVSNLQECTENNVVFSEMRTETQEHTYCQENIFPVDTENISGFEEQVKLSETLKSNDRLDSKEVIDANKLTEDLESSSKSQENCSTLTDNQSQDDSDNNYVLQNLNCDNACQSNNCGLTSNEELPKDNEDTSLQESLDRNTDNEESGLSEEPRSTTYSLTSNDKDHFFDLETSELEEKDLKSIEKQECITESLEKEENSGYDVSLAVRDTESGSKENSVQKCVERSDACEEEPSEQLPTCSSPSFCHDSKQNFEEPISRVKLMVKELECGSYLNSPSEFKRCFKSSSTYDLSDYPPDSERSEYSYMPSSDLTNGSTDESIHEKEYNKGLVKRTIERLYGKAEVSFKPGSKLDAPNVSQMIAGDTEASFHPVIEEATSQCEANHSLSDEKPSSMTSYEIPEEVNKSSNMWEEENVTQPAPQSSPNEEDVWYNEDCSVQYKDQYCQSEDQAAEDEGVLIDKGKWLLKKNHLIRRSPPENLGMYGNIETTSVETMVDIHSDDIPYSHLGNLDLKPPLKEISSSEIEDMAHPFDKGCNYFNMPHNSESEPFPDELSIKSKQSQYGSTLPVEATRKECTTPTQHCREVNTHSSSFRSVEFRLPNNKVHPLEQPSHKVAHVTQPTRNTHSNRVHPEDQNSLDKLHAICGQHCPILMAIVKPANEEVRGCAYQKASDIENQLGLYFLMNMLNLKGQSKDVTKLDNKHVNLKNSCINTITNNILNRFYADNTLEFMNENNLGLLISTAPKENKSLNKLYAIENTDVDTKELNNHEIRAAKEIFRQITIDRCHNVSVFQNSRSNINHVIGAEPAPPADVTEGCEGETSYSYEMFLNNIGQTATVNLEDANIADVTEEIHSYVLEEESSNSNSNSKQS